MDVCGVEVPGPISKSVYWQSAALEEAKDVSKLQKTTLTLHSATRTVFDIAA